MHLEELPMIIFTTVGQMSVGAFWMLGIIHLLGYARKMSASTIDRLIDIGVEPYLIASGVRGVISQRLVRKVCPHCREEYRPSPEEFEAIGLRYDPGVRFYRGSGCPMCFGTGYRGRTGVFEILVIDRALRSRITGGATREELKDAIERTGSFKTMEDSCRELVLTGVTTVEEARKTITALE